MAQANRRKPPSVLCRQQCRWQAAQAPRAYSRVADQAVPAKNSAPATSLIRRATPRTAAPARRSGRPRRGRSGRERQEERDQGEVSTRESTALPHRRDTYRHRIGISTAAHGGTRDSHSTSGSPVARHHRDPDHLGHDQRRHGRQHGRSRPPAGRRRGPRGEDQGVEREAEPVPGQPGHGPVGGRDRQAQRAGRDAAVS